MSLVGNFKIDKQSCTIVGQDKVLGIFSQLLTNSLASRKMGKMKKGRKGGGKGGEGRIEATQG